jgi:threonine/homoserine/homoserine lactone efflux protein
MVTTSAVLGMAAVALGLVLTPGPNMIYLVSRSITQGRAAGFVSLLGVAAGFLVYLAAAAAGLATVFVAVPAAYTALKLAGAAYLLFLAWQALRPGGNSVFAFHELPTDPPRRLFLKVCSPTCSTPRSPSCTSRCSRSSSTQLADRLPSRACCSGSRRSPWR